MKLSSQEALDLEFLLADVSGFIPVNFRPDVPAVGEPYLRDSLALAVAIVSTAEISQRFESHGRARSSYQNRANNDPYP
jgi:hypothetical protein